MLVKKTLLMDMRNSNPCSRMKNLFPDYHTLLRKNGLIWIMDEPEKVAMQHVLSAIRPAKLRTCLESEIEFAHHNLKKEFTKFFQHSTKISEAFVIVDSGALEKDKDTTTINRRKDHKKDKVKAGWQKDIKAQNRKGTSDTEPICLWEPQQ